LDVLAACNAIHAHWCIVTETLPLAFNLQFISCLMASWRGPVAVARGIIVKLAPQVDVLYHHKTTGAFLTRCGWNSVLE